MLATGQKQFEQAAANLCEGGRLLARRLHLPDEVGLALGQVTERWDGKGVPGKAAGEEISRPLRIVRVVHDFVAIAQARDREAAIEALKRRRGRGHDPAIVDAALTEPEALQRAADVPDAWERVIEAEPQPVATISRSGLASVARAFGEFTDVKVGFLHGHSTRVAELAATGADGARLLACRGFGGTRRGLPPRRRQGGGAQRDLGQARPVERGRVGAGSPSSLLHRARPRALRRARAARPGSPARITSGSTAPGTTAEPRPRS